MDIVLLGPPGAGKGTQAAILSEVFGVPKISTGDLIRQEIAKNTLRGRRCAVVANGSMAPAADVRALLLRALRKAPTGAIYDGVVRLPAQADELADLLALTGRRVDAVLQFELPHDELRRRAAGRTVCGDCQTPYRGRGVGEACFYCTGQLVRRPEDVPEVVERRLVTYEDQTRPIYETRWEVPLIRFSGVGSVDAVTRRIQMALRDLGIVGGPPSAAIAA